MREAPALPPGPAAPADTTAAPAPANTQTAVPPVAAAAQTIEEQGKQIFLSRSCIACHAISNTTARGVLGPNLTRFGSRPGIGAGALANNQENLERWITNPRAVKAGAMMPGTQVGAPPPGNPSAALFPPTGLSAEEVRAVAAYLLSLK
jgi:cytochrome c oxidase subunit 2